MLAPPHPFPTRSLAAHKGTCGNALLIAGSRGMAGAAFLAGKACLRTGAGLVTIACPTSSHAALEVKTTCVMTRALPETSEGTLARSALQPLLGLVSDRQSLAVGPGLSRHPETSELVRSLVRVFLGGLAAGEGPRVVLDADGLNAFEGQADDLKPLGGRVVLTPHPGEFRRLAGSDVDLSAEGRRASVEAFVERTGCVTLLKGHRTLVAGPGRATYENGTGNPGLASGGTGDVLTGVIAGLLAQGLEPFPAACLGAWLHGRAADLVARRTGWAPLIATDLLAGLVEVICSVERRSSPEEAS